MHEIDKNKLSDQTKFRLYEIKKTEYYFINVLNETKLCCKNLNKYVAIFNYIDKILVVLSATSEGVQLFHFQVLLAHQLE